MPPLNHIEFTDESLIVAALLDLEKVRLNRFLWNRSHDCINTVMAAFFRE